MSNVIAIIQCRMGSKRLYGKALKDLAGKPLLQHVIERTYNIKGINQVFLSTGMDIDNYPIALLAHSMGCGVIFGSNDNVLERIYLTSRECENDYIVRVTADNPFLDPKHASLAVESAIKSESDFFFVSELPIGVGVEVLKTSTLEYIHYHIDNEYHREHISTYIKQNPILFNIGFIKSNLKNPFSDVRLTVDYEEDYLFAKEIYEALYEEDRIFSTEEIIEFLKWRNYANALQE